jgi:hypothetical protein
MAQVALNVTNANYPSLSDTPEVVLVRSVTAADIAALGIANISFDGGEEPPLMLVIVKGDFDVSSLSGAKRAKYIGYAFDLRAGGPALVASSVKGGRFRQALNDPSLPDDPTTEPDTGQGASADLMPTAIPSLTKLPYGATAAPAALPTPQASTPAP